jgi:hypothetical protein
MPRIVVLVTKNPHKRAEFEKQLDRYGHDVVVDYDVEHKEDLEFYVRKYRILAEKDRFILVAVIRERMELLDPKDRVMQVDGIGFEHHLLPVTNRSTLNFRSFRDKFGETHQIIHCTKGYLNMRGRHNRVDPNIFGWDDIFTELRTHNTYRDLQIWRAKSELIDKISSRDHAIAEFIERVLYYAKKIDLFHNPQNFKSVVDFEKFEDVRKTVEGILTIQQDVGMNSTSNSELNLKYLQSVIRNLCNTVFNAGITFRSPENRRVKLSWMPGLNPGIPFTRKAKDSGQEATYMVHDFGHHVIPDLLYVKGDRYDKPKRLRNKRIYIMYRMMSEAITMVVADMFFVDGVLGGAQNYADVEARRIYPLYLAILNVNQNRIQTLNGLMKLNKQVILANVQYVLTGQYDRYLSLLKCRDEPDVLRSFREKYESFFIEDYRWTEKNYEYFEKIDMDSWYLDMKDLGVMDDMELMSVDEFSHVVSKVSPNFEEDIIRENIDFDTLVEPIFYAVYDLWLSDIFLPGEQIELDRENVRLEKSFRRYMMGQIYLFYRMEGIDDALNNSTFKTNLMERIAFYHTIGEMALEDVELLRSFYNLYLDQLRERGIITSDDVRVYGEVYPILEPFIVNYQEPGEGLRNRLDTFSLECLK